MERAVVQEYIVEGTVASFHAEQQQRFIAVLSNASKVGVDRISLRVEAASVKVTATFSVASVAESEEVVNLLNLVTPKVLEQQLNVSVSTVKAATPRAFVTAAGAPSAAPASSPAIVVSSLVAASTAAIAAVVTAVTTSRRAATTVSASTPRGPV
jgi:hypothetical protein